MTLPRFSVEQDWAQDGNVDIWFGNNIDRGVQQYVATKLAEKVPHMKKEERCEHHLTRLICNAFQDMIEKEEIRHSGAVDKWTLAKEV